mgnify:CR=1 FL=1
MSKKEISAKNSEELFAKARLANIEGKDVIKIYNQPKKRFFKIIYEKIKKK